jgi:hypothetical protein
VKAGQAGRRIEVHELFQKPGRLGAGAGQGSVDRTEYRGEVLGLVKLEQPASHFSAGCAHGQQMKQVLIQLT